MNEDIHAPADAPKPVLRLKSQKFREARQSDWRALSSQLDKVEKRGLGSFSIDELLNLRRRKILQLIVQHFSDRRDAVACNPLVAIDDGSTIGNVRHNFSR